MIDIVEQVVTVASLTTFSAYIIIVDVMANKKLKGGR